MFNQIWLNTTSLTRYLSMNFNKFITSFSPCMVEVFHAWLIHYLKYSLSI